MAKIGILLIARLGSTRLPKKVLIKIQGNNLIQIILKRIKGKFAKENIVLCTTCKSVDDALINLADNLDIKSFRGENDFVMKRMLDACIEHKFEHFVRLTCDNPIVEIEYIEKLINFHLENCCDYTSTCHKNTPVGINIEVCSKKYLEYIVSKCQNPKNGDYFTFYVDSDNSKKFKKMTCKIPEYNHNKKGWRFTVDYQEDIDFFNALSKKCDLTSAKTSEIFNILSENPNISKINKEKLNPYHNKIKEKCLLGD